ncbi:hypothetical protein BC835DRAFT_1439452 [Cytidiella melzeri]|nr:hypothetical protein BC835DRAFT_1439452 [Cytidiella melzeri]
MTTLDGPVYDLPIKQLINSTFTDKVASTTGDSPFQNPNVVAADLAGTNIPKAQQYYEIKVVFGSDTYYLYQNVLTGGFVYVDSLYPNTSVTESTCATLWTRSGGNQYTAIEVALPSTGWDPVYLALPKDTRDQPMVLATRPSAVGAQWAVRDAGN